MWLEIEAFDTLFFRDGKPFSMGEETAGQSIFPPTPSVVYGALLSDQFVRKGRSFSKTLIDAYLQEVSIKSFLLARESDSLHPLFPIPADLVIYKGAREKSAELIDYEENLSSLHNAPTPGLLVAKRPAEPVNKAFLDLEQFQSYISGQKGPFDFWSEESLVSTETKIGIGLNKITGTVKEGQLYRIGLKRPVGENLERMKFLVELEENLPESDYFSTPGSMRIGGEGKGVFYRPTEKPFDIPPPTAEESSIFKLYLATPAIFEDGALPFDQRSGGSPHQRVFQNIQVDIMAYSCTRPFPIGGWDMLANRPKPMVKAVAAGAVYYLSIKDENDRQRFIQAVHGKSISQAWQEQGFGIAYLGKIAQD